MADTARFTRSYSLPRTFSWLLSADRMGSNLAVLLLNKLLLTYGSFRHPVLLTFLHMASTVLFIWGLRSLGFLSIQPVQSRQQLLKLVALSVVFSMAVLCANVSLKFLAVSMNQAIGAATPVFAAIFAFLLQGEVENLTTYSTLLIVTGGVILASHVEPDLHLFGAFVCFLGAAFRGLRAVLQAILLKPQEKLDSLSCLAYMAPVSGVLTMLLIALLEPSSINVLAELPGREWSVVWLVCANCGAAFASNFYNMAVTRRTSALTIQVLGQCKGVISAVVSVACFHNVVPAAGWFGYGVTVLGCTLYGRCKAHSRILREQWLKRTASQGTLEEGTGSLEPLPVSRLPSVLGHVDSGGADQPSINGSVAHHSIAVTRSSMQSSMISGRRAGVQDVTSPELPHSSYGNAQCEAAGSGDLVAGSDGHGSIAAMHAGNAPEHRNGEPVITPRRVQSAAKAVYNNQVEHHDYQSRRVWHDVL